MEKWADCLISHVRYDDAETQIDQVRARADHGDKLGEPSEVTRRRVVALLKNGTTFMTIYKSTTDSDRWTEGAAVRIVRIDDTDYIRTDADQAKQDNLGNLPRF
jgi:hypothetical protein